MMKTKTVKLDEKTSLEIVTSKDFKNFIIIDVSWNKKDIEKVLKVRIRNNDVLSLFLHFIKSILNIQY